MAKSIVFFLDSFGAGGTEKHVLQLLQSDLVAKYNISLACSRFEGPMKNRFIASGVEINQFQIRPLLDPIGNIKNILILLSFLSKRRVDCIHSFGGMTNIVGPIAGRLAGVPHIITSERNTFVWKEKGYKKYLSMLLNRYIVSHILVNAYAVKKGLIERENLKASKIHAIYNGITIKSTPSIEERINNRTWLTGKLGLLPTNFVIICVARMAVYKGHADLLEAFKIIYEENPTVVLLLVGDGHERERLQTMVYSIGIEKAVYFLGIRNDVTRLIDASDLLVLASRANEGMPNVVLEAMERGLPVVATDVGGTSELIGANIEAGLVVPPCKPELMAKSIQRVIENSEIRRHLGLNGRKYAEKQFNLEKMINNYKSFYKGIGLAG